MSMLFERIRSFLMKSKYNVRNEKGEDDELMITKSKIIRFGFYKNWFTFPFSINVTRDYFYIGRYWKVSINFLWWRLIYDDWCMRAWMRKRKSMKKRKEQIDEHIC